jgi:hypothetical protein
MLAAEMDDSFEYSLSPIRQAARIEDSVEAIDALEDALEQIGRSLPNVDDGLDSPVRGRSPTEGMEPVEVGKRTRSVKGGKTTSSLTRNKRVESQGRTTSQHKPPVAQRRTATPKSPHPAGTNWSRAEALKKLEGTSSSTPRAASKPTVSTAAKEGKAPTEKKTKPLSTSKPGFVPAKSSKPATRPTFELPGEAISRRLKAQREEKLKKEEEERQRRREFKARPVRISSVPSVAVKETASSRNRARASLIGEDFEKDLAQQQTPAAAKRHSAIITPTRSPTSYRKASVDSSASKRTSLLSVSKRPSLNSLATRASSTSRGPGAPSPTISISHAGSEIDAGTDLTSPPRKGSFVTPADAVYQKARGKEIFQRDQLQKEERDRERREKEEAAKRARAEAAERGRLASREWAERQRLKVKNSVVEMKAGREQRK